MITEPCVTAGKVAEHMGVVEESVSRWRERKGVRANRIAVEI
jgi:hypothetical protein